MKKRQIILITAICIFLIMVCMVIYVIKEKNLSISEHTDNINTMLYSAKCMDTGNTCIITLRDEEEKAVAMCYSEKYMPGDYIYTTHYKYVDEGGVYIRPCVDNLLTFDIEIYDIITKEKIDSIDMATILKEYIPDSNVSIVESCFTESDETFFWVDAWKEGKEYKVIIEYPEKNVYVVEDIQEHQEFYDAFCAIEERKQARWHIYQLMRFDEFGLLNNCRLEESKSMNNRTAGRILCRDAGKRMTIQITGGTLPLNNTKLYDQFPGLKEYQGNNEVMVTIYFEEEPSAEDILSLLIEEGQEISYEGCVLPAELSVDGQSHDIHRFEEYVQWRKQEE